MHILLFLLKLLVKNTHQLNTAQRLSCLLVTLQISLWSGGGVLKYFTQDVFKYESFMATECNGTDNQNHNNQEKISKKLQNTETHKK